MKSQKKHSVSHRDFLKTSAMAGTTLLTSTAFISYVKSTPPVKGLRLVPTRILGQLKEKGDSMLLPDAMKYVAEETGDGFVFQFPKGSLEDKRFISSGQV